MWLIDADTKITALLYNEEREETEHVEMTVADYLDSYTEEGCPSTVSGWISVKDGPPKSGKHVFVTCEIRSLYGYKKQYVCEAFYAAEHSISEGKYLYDTDCYDYSEEDDEYYLKEGWYEVIHNCDEYSSIVIGDFVTHWMPLPEAPEEVSNGNVH